jgi:hypothetical protein
MLRLDAGSWRRRTIGADEGHDRQHFVAVACDLGATPHVTQNVIRIGRGVPGSNPHSGG